MEDDQNLEQREGQGPAGQEQAPSETPPAAPEETAPPMVGSASTTPQEAQTREATQQGFMEKVRSFFNRK